jgi:DUF2971 family protein
MQYPSGSNLDPAWHRHLGAEHLFHYTSFEGLTGILSSGQLWATDLRYLNDTSEFEYSRTFAINKLHEIEERRRGTSLIPVLSATIRAIQELKRPLFAVSFAVGGDLLSLWRGYCRPGNGFAIAFSRRRLEQLSKRRGWQLWPIVYSPDAQRDCLDVMEFDAVKKAGPNPSPASFAKAYTDAFVRVGPFIKNPRYFEEGEWRIMPRTARRKVHVRNKGKSRIPYVRLALASGRLAPPMEYILVGPDPSPNHDVNAIKQWCRSKRISLQIRASEVPYRAHV